MAEAAKNAPAKTEQRETPPPAARGWQPIEHLRQEIDRLFEDFHRGLWRSPFQRTLFDIEPSWRRGLIWGTAPAVDFVEKDKEYEVAAELPGMDESNIELNFADGVLTIKGEKKEEKEEKKKDIYLSERRYGSFQRSLRVPEGVDADKIVASFKKGVLVVTLPKTPEAQKKAKKIAISTT